MKYIAIFHANLNYAYLTPDRYEFVIRESYELIFDTMREEFPDTQYVFEASGYTLEQIAMRCPDVLEKLKAAIASGQCEFMGSPHAHPMLPNFPAEDGRWSLEFAMRTYERFLGARPASFWNPECGWRSYIPEMVQKVGYRNLLGDFEAYSRSVGPDGTPLRPEIYEKEHTDEEAFYSFGFQYDLPGDEKAIHFPFDNVAGVEPATLKTFLRTDRIAQFGVRYFMGMEGYTLDRYMELIRRWSDQKPDEEEGAVIVFADDAEYIGTNGWFRLKFLDQPDRVFEKQPTAREDLVALISECRKLGEFTTFDGACNELPALQEPLSFDDDSAWHGARSSVWAATPMARLLRPWQDLVRAKLNAGGFDKETTERAWYHLTNSYNSDGQWPPTLPEAPHIVHPFNYRYCFENLLAAELLVGGVDRDALHTDPAATLREILGLQQERVLVKVKQQLASGDEEGKETARRAQALIERSRCVTDISQSGQKVLYPAEYTVRADALVEARRLVGGIAIEDLDEDTRDEGYMNE